MRVSEVMKAAVLFGRDDLRVVEAPVPKPEKDELLIRVHACGICGTDPHIISNGWRGQPPFGEYIPGHEYAGEVVRLGESVDEFKIGDRVASEPATGCNRCENCVRGLYTICLNYGNRKRGHRHIGFTANGGYAEYTVAPVRCLHPIPDNITYEEATMVTTAGTSLWGIERIGGIGGGDSVVVIGPGAIGLIAQQAAKAFGAGQVIVTGTRDSRLELAKRLGADHTINVRREDPVAKVNELTGGLGADIVLWCAQSPESAAQAVQMAKLSGATVIAIDIHESKLKAAESLGADYTINSRSKNVPAEVRRLEGERGVDVAYEFVGRTETMNDALNILARGGKLVFVGYSEDKLTLDPRRLVGGEFQVVGSRASSIYETIEVVKLVREGKFRLEPLITHRLPLDKINDGLDLVRRGEAIRAVVMP